MNCLVKKEVRERIERSVDFTREIEEDELFRIIDEEILKEIKQNRVSLSQATKLRKEIYHSLRKLDVLQELVDDPSVTEIMVNGKDVIFVERAGKIERTEYGFETGEKLEDIIQQIVSGCNRVVNESSPIVDARLENGSRVNVVLNPIALNGPIVTIRRFPDRPFTMEDLIRFGAIPPDVCEFLRRLVVSGYNIFISGGTGSGKTTFLNALSNYIPSDERVITIEDSAELQLLSIDNLVRLETRNANSEGCLPITIRDLIKSALRMRPDRIVVGEVRGAEAVDLLQAMNTGHDGSLSTGHSNSAADALSRLETMVLMGMNIPISAIRRQIASALDIIVHLGRLRDKSRKVLEIIEVLGCDTEIILKPLYAFDYEKNMLVQKGVQEHVEKLKAAGFDDISSMEGTSHSCAG